MTENEYKTFQRFLKDSCGIVLSDHKQYLVKNRLADVLFKFDFADFSELAKAIQVDSLTSAALKTAVIDAMTTNETFWFRDDIHFLELKQKIFPEIFSNISGSIKIWSSACSSGQEPYSISMCVEDVVKQTGKNKSVQIIGTDISESILKQAKSAVYSDTALSRGLEGSFKNLYFEKIHGGYKLNSEITNRVRFQQFNLLKPFSVLGSFNIIFCRNVLIYFSEEVKHSILTKMVGSLEPGGYIFLSSTESMPTSVKGLELVRNGKARYFKKLA